MHTKAYRVSTFGGPEVLDFVDVPLPPPADNEARIRHTAIGVNFIDTYHRSGLYPLPLPTGIGSEAVGIVEDIGAGVGDVRVGDRVAYTGRPADAYAERRNFVADRLVRVPDELDDERAAAVFLKGMTAWFLLHRSYRVQAGDPILVYAAAGGVGSLLCQWAAHLGATVIGVVGSEAKAAVAKDLGCAHVIRYDRDDIAETVRGLTGGSGVPVVYDSVGKATFMASLDALRPHGVMVTYGNASGAVEPFAPSELAKRGSLYVTRPVLFDFIDTRERLLEAAETVFNAVASGVLQVNVNHRFALADAADAHRALESRATTGATVLIP